MKKKKIISWILAVCVCIASFPLSVSAETTSITAREFGKSLYSVIYEYDFQQLSSSTILTVPANRLIVKTENNAEIEENYGAVVSVDGYKGIHIFQYETKSMTDSAYEKFLNDESVDFVEYDFYVSAENEISSTSSKSVLSSKFLSYNSDVAGVSEAFGFIEKENMNCHEIQVAVIDTGLYVEHNYFDKNRIIDSEYSFIFEDEVYLSTEDDMNHGTHVSGIVYDNTMDSIKIVPYRAYTNFVITTYSLICNAFDAAVEDNVDVINMSYAMIDNGQSNSCLLFSQSINEAVKNGIVVVAAAGNERTDAAKRCPANCESAITVSATNTLNAPDKSYTNYGECVDVASPGTDINSTVPRLWNWYEEDVEDGKIYEETPQSLYKELSGTSMASPLVAAAAATLKSINPDLTPQEIERIIKETAYVPEDWEENCGDKNYGTGIVNFYNMVKQEISAQPTIKLNKDNKFEIIAPEGTDARLYYTLDGSEPTPDNHILYTEPFEADSKNVDKIKAVCHENGKLISETVTHKTKHRVSETINYRQTKGLLSDSYTGKVYWHSNNPEIASVDENGNVTGVSVGQTYIYAAFESGKEIRYLVTVEYTWWQEILIYFCLGFIWYI